MLNLDNQTNVPIEHTASLGNNDTSLIPRLLICLGIRHEIFNAFCIYNSFDCLQL